MFKFVNMLNVLVPQRVKAVKLARIISGITQDSIVAIWKANKEIHDKQRREKVGCV